MSIDPITKNKISDIVRIIGEEVSSSDNVTRAELQQELSTKADITELHRHPNIEVLNSLSVKIWTGTMTDYEGITPKDDSTLYFIVKE